MLVEDRCSVPDTLTLPPEERGLMLLCPSRLLDVAEVNQPPSGGGDSWSSPAERHRQGVSDHELAVATIVGAEKREEHEHVGLWQQQVHLTGR